jgi:hypothetical protein
MISLNLKKITKRLLRPLYYSGIAYRVFSLIEKMTGYTIERHRVLREIGYYPNLQNPKSFNEKILWKKIYDRNPLLPIVADKYRVRKYIREVLGDKEAKKILVPLFYVTDNPRTIPFDSLEGEYVIKPNHLSHKIILAEDIDKQKRYTVIDGCSKSVLPDSRQTRDEIIDTCREWLTIKHGFYKHEWAYQPIKRKILVERLLRDNSRNIPANYNFSILHGKCQLIAVFYNKFDDRSIAKYTPEWEYLDLQSRLRQASYEEKPENLESMLELAELLGKPFDFIRVDLYSVDDKIYFSELTNYPLSGTLYYNQVSFDFEIGSKWTIVPNYWKYQ